MDTTHNTEPSETTPETVPTFFEVKRSFFDLSVNEQLELIDRMLRGMSPNPEVRRKALEGEDG